MSLWWLVGLPALVGTALALVGITGRRERVERAAVPLAVATAAVVLGLAATVAVTRPEVSAPFLAVAPLGLGVDGLSAAVVVTVAAVALLVLVFALGDPGEDLRTSRARFAGLMLVFVAAVMLTATATTLPALLLAWEVMGATSYALIGFSWREDGRAAGGTTAFLVTRAGDLGLYAAVAAALAGGVPDLSLAAATDASPGWRHVIVAGVLVAALGKAAQLPFSFWLSRAMVGPSEVSALLHSAAMVAMGGYLLLRTSPLLEATGWAGPTTAWIGAATAVALGAVALAQRDLKQLLAASTAAQLGFVVLAAGVGAVAGGTAHLVAHAATKALLFLVAGVWLSALGTKQLPALLGVARRYPLVGVLAAIGALALAGVPPLALWATKDEVLAAARETSLPLYVAGLAGAALSAGYAGKVLVVVWRRVPGGDVAAVEAGFDDEQPGVRRVTAGQEAPLVVLAAGAAALGVLALPPIGDRLRALVGDTTSATAGAGELALSAALAVVVVALAILTGRRARAEPRAARGRAGAWLAEWLDEWLGLEVAAHALVVRPTLRLAGLVARVDDHVLDAGVQRAATATLAAARAVAVADDRVLDAGVDRAATATLGAARDTASADDRGVDATVSAVARTARRLGTLARRPQTGLLHQYYLQAVVALVVAVAVLLVPLALSALSCIRVPVLTAVVFLPLAAAAVLAVVRVSAPVARRAWLAVTAADLLLVVAASLAYRTPAAGALAYEQQVAWIPGIGASYHVGLDGLSLPLVALTDVVFTACAVYALREENRPRAHAALMLFLQTACLGVFAAQDLIVFFVFFDLSIVGMYFAIAGWGHGQALAAALKFFLYTFLGSLALLLGFIGLYVHAAPHTFDMVELAQQTPLAGTGTVGTAVLAAVLVGLFVKTPTVPFHTWLPPAHTNASATGSAVLAGVMLKLGTYGFVRVAMPLLPQAWAGLAWVVLAVGVVSVLWGALVALGQSDVKRMIAYTSVNHMGYVVLAVGAAGLVGDGAASAAARELAVTGAVTQMVSHGLITTALFLLTGVLWQRRQSYALDGYGGLAGPAPVFAALLGIAAFASLGLPGFSGFVAELQVFAGSIAVAPVAAVALLGILLTAGLFLRALQLVLTGEERGASPGFADAGAREVWAVAPLLVLAVVIGVAPRPLLAVIEPASAAVVASLDAAAAGSSAAGR